ncbi:hypothetical protein AMATHDRAFT_76561 [Amanita thiersii Skay4041]|uniref:Chaperone DnaJ C-terminal domain-containing protein n=1 Tax=Amanita thiersii Skay4041 TaxID=703135 RepID=A0A2A9NKI1_9AGAR|nr:hypothetical protein AMATHDRAFT_76561 [Amanita thiersii Skay4041]
MYFRITRKYQTGKTKGVVLDVDIPAGCHDGTKMVFRDAGHEMKDGTKQDIVFVIREVRHEKCGEDDLVMQVRLPWVERLKDEKAKVVVTGVDGKELVFEVDCRVGKGRERPKMSGVAVIEGAGMPLKGGERGTLFIK